MAGFNTWQDSTIKYWHNSCSFECSATSAAAAESNQSDCDKVAASVEWAFTLSSWNIALVTGASRLAGSAFTFTFKFTFKDGSCFTSLIKDSVV